MITPTQENIFVAHNHREWEQTPGDSAVDVSRDPKTSVITKRYIPVGRPLEKKAVASKQEF